MATPIDPDLPAQAAAHAAIVPEERHRFSALLLENPNFFGNIAGSDLPAIKPMKGNTSFEQLVCVGLNPAFDRLEGVIEVKLDSGYGGDICSDGTFEHVRFFVDLYDNGVWHDVGVASVRVRDVPGAKPLAYAVHLDFSPFRRFCTSENIVKVRAVLQWNAAPPSDPDYPPVWGNVVDREVQIRPSRTFSFGDFVDQLPPGVVLDAVGPIVDVLDASATVPTVKAEPMSLAAKQALYADHDVPAHRFAFKEATQMLANVGPAGGPSVADLGLATEDVGALFAAIGQTDGDTSYEELGCIGLEPEAGYLDGVITIKRPVGYGGPLCGAGSTEYVAFWIDFGSGFEHMGTTSVNVHDLATIPDGDVSYAVFLKKDLSKYQVPCQKGPRVVRLRAILSWSTPPPAGNPNHVPTWGNREDRLIVLEPGQFVGHEPFVETIGGVEVDDIDLATGLTEGIAARPFGGVLTLTGRIGNPPDSFGGGEAAFLYRIEVKGPAPFDSWASLTDPQSIAMSTTLNGIPQECAPGEHVCSVPIGPIDVGDGLGKVWYRYLEDTSGPNTRARVGSDVLVDWPTSVAMEGTWDLRITARDPATSTLFPGSQLLRVRIDNTAPSGPAGPLATIEQNEALPPLEITKIDGVELEKSGNCGKFPVGSLIEGTYKIHDPGITKPEQHFSRLTLDVIPDGPANGVNPSPTERNHPVVSTNGEDGDWSLNTTGMDACGYVVRLTAIDRSIVNNGVSSNTFIFDVGFCLEDPKP